MDPIHMAGWIRGSALRGLARVSRFAIFGVLAGIAVPSQPAQATCAEPRLFSSFGVSYFGYIFTPGCSSYSCGTLGSSISDDAVGAFWAIGDGNPAVGPGIDNGGFPFLPGWAYVYPGYPAAILSSWSADPLIDGCIDNAADPLRCMAVMLADLDQTMPGDPAGAFALVTDLPDGASAYDFESPTGRIDLEPLQAPTITLATSVGGGTGLALTVNALSVSDIEDGLYLDPSCETDLVQGYQMYWSTMPSGDPPPTSRDLGSWNVSGPVVPLGTAGTVTVSCATLAGNDLYLARGLVFESGFVTPYVSRNSAPVSTCEGAVAVPGVSYPGQWVLALTLAAGLLLLLRRRLRPGAV